MLKRHFCHQIGSSLFTSRPRQAVAVVPRTVCQASRSAAAPLQLLSPTEESTAHLARLVSRKRQRGDCICLYGDVGAGKSLFSRAFIRAVEGDNELPVPSPTYLLQNIYDFEKGSADLARLDLHSSLSTAVSLVEWADRLGPAQPAERLDVSLEILSPVWLRSTPVTEALGRTYHGQTYATLKGLRAGAGE